MDRYIIASVLPDEIANYHSKLVNEVADKFKLRTINTPTHITFKDSFYTDNISEIVNILNKFTENHDFKNLQAITDNIGNFEEKIFFLNAKLNEDALFIYNSLLNRLKDIEWMQWDKYDTSERHFHITITNKANRDNAIQIKKYLEKYQPNFQYSLKNLSILKKIEDEKRWIVEHKTNL